MSLSELERSHSEYKKKQLISRAEYLSNFEDWKRVNAEMGSVAKFENQTIPL